MKMKKGNDKTKRDKLNKQRTELETKMISMRKLNN
jgi:hypothetical protein